MGGLRERKKLRTRTELMTTAIRLFAEHGFDQVTVDDVAAAAGVSPRTFFRYFDSKAAAVFGNTSILLEGLQRALAERPAGVSTIAAFTEYWLREAQIVYDHPDAYHAQHELAAQHTHVAAERSRTFDRMRTVMIDALQAEDPRRPLVEVEMLGSMMASTIFTALRVWHEHGGDPRRILRDCMRAVERAAG